MEKVYFDLLYMLYLADEDIGGNAMYKVIIVDDELYVVALIERLIQWEELDMEVVGRAYDGLAALETVRTLKPDIVVLDVCMPEYDGIALMQEIRKMNTDIKFIVISGHKKFEYARSAIQYNIEDYLLKPIDRDEFYHILEKLKKKIDLERSSEEEVKILDQQLAETKQQLRTYFVDLLCSKKINWEEWSVPRLQATYYLDLQRPLFKVVLLKLDIGEQEVDADFQKDIMESISQHVKECLTTPDYEMLTGLQGMWVTILFNYVQEGEADIISALKNVHQQLKAMVEKFEKIKITMVIGDTFDRIEDADQAVSNVKRSMGMKISLGCGRIFTVSERKELEGAAALLLDKARESRLEDLFREWDDKKLRKLLMEVFSSADTYRNQDTLIYCKLAEAVGTLFFNHLKHAGLLVRTTELMKEQLDERIMNCMEQSDVRRMLCCVLSEYMQEAKAANQSGESPAVRLAKKYIAKNYKENITLAQVAEAVSLSRVYFSILFKRETGMNFLEYINQCRIDAAKEMLKDIRYNIGEVAEASGFQDSRYFSKVFKKAVGISPSDYRSRQMN